MEKAPVLILGHCILWLLGSWALRQQNSCLQEGTLCWGACPNPSVIFRAEHVTIGDTQLQLSHLTQDTIKNFPYFNENIKKGANIVSRSGQSGHWTRQNALPGWNETHSPESLLWFSAALSSWVPLGRILSRRPKSSTNELWGLESLLCIKVWC